MVQATNLGFPRIGANRELKKAVESYWKGQSDSKALLKEGKRLRTLNWKLQQKAGLDHIPSNDFSFYDHILDLTATLGLIPQRYQWIDQDEVDLDTYFAMARGAQKDNLDVTAMDMSKWFDTNYHYLVPEFEKDAKPKLSSNKIFDDFDEAKSLGIITRPVIVGPATYTFIGKAQYEGFDPISFVQSLIPVYNEIFEKLAKKGATWVQIDEPILALDLSNIQRTAIELAYKDIKTPTGLKILLTSYFDGLRDNTDLAFSLPVDGVHIDLCRGAGQANCNTNNPDAQLTEALAQAGTEKTLSLGVVDGRNIWKNNLNKSLGHIEKAVQALGKERVFVASSSSLLHTPVDLESETELEPEIKNWLSFATQKLDEIVTLANGVNNGREVISEALYNSDNAQSERQTSTRIHDSSVKERLSSITPKQKKRLSPFAQRQTIQREALNLPTFPTTTIGSFPQTKDIRQTRASFKKGKIDKAEYQAAMEAEIRLVVDYQHEAGLDVLVHGEPERNDMVEYFGEQLAGFIFTKKAWVQSYGSRCVKPPIIFGDVSRPNPMTVEWSKYAQSQTDKIMKGMLTGPITILQWSFVRDDQPRSVTATQIALAIRDEVADLEKAGIRMIQIDEAAFREGLPLRRADWQAYLDNAVDDFRLSSSCVSDETQIHTHMCYSEFNDVIESIGAMDADVISIETSRSQMELLEAFGTYDYPNEIGPGVYDIHSPRVPSVEEMVTLLEKARRVLNADQLWVNPDCGLKTRGWTEVKPALENMVKAAKFLRTQVQKEKAA